MGFNLGKSVTCCYECQERYPACHDYCEKYISEKAEYDERQKMIRDARAKQHDFDQFKKKAIAMTKNKGRLRSGNGSCINHKSYKK